MRTLIKIAWRNIWRNKRRTLITVSSIMFALFFAIIMRGFQRGSYAKMKKNAIESYSGYVQIHKKGYWEDKNINNTFTIDDSVYHKLSSNTKIKAVLPRLESFALASSGVSTKGVAVMGIDPEKENTMTKVESFLVDGSYISNNDKGVLLAEGLANYLKLQINDTLVLFSSGYHGMSAAGLYPVKGIVKLPMPEMDRATVYMPLNSAREFYSAPGRYSDLVFNLNDIDDTPKVVNFLSENIDLDRYEVMRWETLNKELVQLIESDNAGGIVMIAILYLVIAFGIFGTVLMMTNERLREFSMMISVGMQKTKLAFTVVMELAFLTTLGVIGGSLISIPLMLYFYYNPIKMNEETTNAFESFNMEAVLPVSLDWEIFMLQAIAITILSLIAMSYPTFKILNLNVIKNLKS